MSDPGSTCPGTSFPTISVKPCNCVAMVYKSQRKCFVRNAHRVSEVSIHVIHCESQSITAQHLIASWESVTSSKGHLPQFGAQVSTARNACKPCQNTVTGVSTGALSMLQTVRRSCVASLPSSSCRSRRCQWASYSWEILPIRRSPGLWR